MTDLTIDMVKDFSSAKKHGGKTPADRRESDRAAERVDAADGCRTDGATVPPNPLASLLSRAKNAKPDDPDGGRSANADGSEKESRDGSGDREPPCDEANRFDADEEEFEELACCLEACPSFSFHYHEGLGGWAAPSTLPGKSCRILCTPLRAGVARIEIDTGYRVRRGRIRKANLFAMMANGILRLRGFERIGHDGAVRFAYMTACDDPARLERQLMLALACCEEAIRLFSLVSLGTSPSKAFAIYAGDYDELDDLDLEIAYDADFDPEPRGKIAPDDDND